MDERVRKNLLKASNDLYLYSITSSSEVEEVFNFKPSKDLEIASSDKISRYTIILAQYLITLQVKFNTARVIAGEKRKVLDRLVSKSIEAGKVKGATLKERQANAIIADPILQDLEIDYNEAAAERDLLEGLDKPITELINAFKSELRRRTEERNAIHRERL